MKITLDPNGPFPPSEVIAANIRSILKAASVSVGSVAPNLNPGSSITVWFNDTTGEVKFYSGVTQIPFTLRNCVVSPTTPTSPIIGLQWLNTTDGALYTWDGSAWASSETAVVTVADQAARLALSAAAARGSIVKQESDTTLWCLKPAGTPSNAADWEALGYYNITIGNVQGLSTTLTAITDSVALKAAQADLDALTQTVASKAPKDSPEFTGTPTAPTPVAGTNSERIATTAFVVQAISGLSGGGDTAWGGISGNIASQADLSSALAGKQPVNSNLTNYATNPTAEILDKLKGTLANPVKLGAEYLPNALSADSPPTAAGQMQYEQHLLAGVVTSNDWLTVTIVARPDNDPVHLAIAVAGGQSAGVVADAIAAAIAAHPVLGSILTTDSNWGAPGQLQVAYAPDVNDPLFHVTIEQAHGITSTLTATQDGIAPVVGTFVGQLCRQSNGDWHRWNGTSWDRLYDDPPTSLTASKSVVDQAARLALTEAGAKGFAVIDSDTGKTWMLKEAPWTGASGAWNVADWLQIGDRDITWTDVNKTGALPSDIGAAHDLAGFVAITSASATIDQSHYGKLVSVSSAGGAVKTLTMPTPPAEGARFVMWVDVGVTVNLAGQAVRVMSPGGSLTAVTSLTSADNYAVFEVIGSLWCVHRFGSNALTTASILEKLGGISPVASRIGAEYMPLEIIANQPDGIYIDDTFRHDSYIRFSNAGVNTVDLTLNSSNPLPVGFAVTLIRNTGAGPFTFNLEGGVTVYNSAAISTVPENGACRLVKVGTDTWDLVVMGPVADGVISNPAAVTGATATQITNIVRITQAQYNLLGTPDPNITYIITP